MVTSHFGPADNAAQNAETFNTPAPLQLLLNAKLVALRDDLEHNSQVDVHLVNVCEHSS
jgi:hypothetical protein